MSEKARIGIWKAGGMTADNVENQKAVEKTFRDGRNGRKKKENMGDGRHVANS